MSLPLRITFEQRDYTYTVLTRGINKQTGSIKISLNDQEFTLVRNPNNEWLALEEMIGEHPGLLQAVARNIVLRYRL